MNTTGFITRFWKNATLPKRLCEALAFGVFSLLAYPGGPALATEVEQLRVERAEEGIYLSASVRFDLPPVVEDALLKGIPMFFVVEADIYRSRWYWTDRRVASAARTIRMAYQPLTRRWRVNIVSGIINSSSGLRATLNQNYDTLPEALSAIQRISRWKIAEPAEIEADEQHQLEFRFRLDLSQLPRPFQIGVAGQRDWTISAESNRPLQFEAPKPAAALGSKEAVQEAAK